MGIDRAAPLIFDPNFEHAIRRELRVLAHVDKSIINFEAAEMERRISLEYANCLQTICAYMRLPRSSLHARRFLFFFYCMIPVRDILLPRCGPGVHRMRAQWGHVIP